MLQWTACRLLECVFCGYPQKKNIKPYVLYISLFKTGLVCIFGGWPPAGCSSITCLIGTIYYRLYRQPNIRKFDIYFDTCFFYKNKKLFNHIWREESPNCQSAEESQYTLGQLIK